MIPEMTDPLGRYWDQPDRSEIAVDATHALMTKATWGKLANYERSHPSGVYEGKMWRSGRHWLFWFGPSTIHDHCSLQQRLIIIVD